MDEAVLQARILLIQRVRMYGYVLAALS